MGMLSVTFRGPFLLVVPQPTAAGPAQTVDIYAPTCDQHLGSVFFGDGSYPLYGNNQNGNPMQYILSGVNANPGPISFQWNLNKTGVSMVLSPDSVVPPVVPRLNLQSAYFRVTVPRPKIFYALNSVKDTEVVTGAGPTGNYPVYLTAFRLYYDWDLVTPIQLATPTNVSALPWGITPPAGTNPGANPGWLPLADSGDIEFQFEGPGLSDPDHQDASACFNQIAQLAGLTWYLSFDNGAARSGPAFRTGADCLALPIAIGIGN